VVNLIAKYFRASRFQNYTVIILVDIVSIDPALTRFNDVDTLAFTPFYNISYNIGIYAVSSPESDVRFEILRDFVLFYMGPGFFYT
jgi:hypothetical protein